MSAAMFAPEPARSRCLSIFSRIASNDMPPPPNSRLLLSALEDPHKIVPANMMLLFVTARWPLANTWPDTKLPYVFMASDGKTAAPDLSCARPKSSRNGIRSSMSQWGKFTTDG